MDICIERLYRAIIDLPKIKSIVPDPANPQGDRLLLLRVENEGTVFGICPREDIYHIGLQESRPCSRGTGVSQGRIGGVYPVYAQIRL